MFRAALALVLVGSPVILSGDVDGPIFLARSQNADTAELRILPLTSGAAECDGTLQGADEEVVTTTRASSAYCTKEDGTMVLLSSNEPRTYNVSGEPVWLTEGAKTNVMLRSQEFDSASWLTAGTSGAATPTVTANQTVAPDGTTTADRVQFGATAGSQESVVYQTLGSGSTTVSVYAKGVSASGTLDVCNNTANGCAQCNYTSTAWTRCSLTMTGIGSSWLFGNSSAANGGQAKSALDVYLWQADVVVGTELTSPIPTAGTTATRAADSINVADAALANLDGSNYCVSAKVYNLGLATTRGWYSFDSAGGAFSRAFWNASATTHLNQIWDATLDSKTITSTIASGAKHIRVCTVGGTMTTYVDGASSGASSGTGDGVLDTVPTTVWLGRHLTASGHLNGYMGNFCVGPAGSCAE